jgi:hypothetical protein
MAKIKLGHLGWVEPERLTPTAAVSPVALILSTAA